MIRLLTFAPKILCDKNVVTQFAALFLTLAPLSLKCKTAFSRITNCIFKVIAFSFCNLDQFWKTLHRTNADTSSICSSNIAKNSSLDSFSSSSRLFFVKTSKITSVIALRIELRRLYDWNKKNRYKSPSIVRFTQAQSRLNNQTFLVILQQSIDSNVSSSLEQQSF